MPASVAARLAGVRADSSFFITSMTKTANLDAIFDQLRLRKIIKIVATRCQILRLECTKFDYSAPPDPLAGFKGAYF